MTELPGVDYPWQHPGGAALKAAGKVFACRYLSYDPSKNLTRTEADDLAAHGIWAVLVWEATANRAGAGRAAGVADAKTAEAQAAAAGMPSGRPIYFAVDYDAVPTAVDAYFQGVASVIGLARTGVYGGYRVVKHLKDAGLASWIWQTTAWSGGQWDPRANLQQPLGTVRINGAECDIDTAHTPDYGQWMPGKTPLTEDDMTPEQANQLTALHDLLVPYAGWGYKNADADAASVKAGKGHIPDAYGYLTQTHTMVKAQSAAITALVAQLGKDVDTATVVAAVQKAIADAVVHVQVDVTGEPTA